MSSNDSPLLRADHVSRIYDDGQVQALSDVSLTIHQGEYVAIVGPSGSGKSTLLNVLGGLDEPTSGHVLFKEQTIRDAAALDRLRSTEIGYVFQSFYLLPTLTAVENVQLPMFETGLNARQREDKANELLETVGMTHRADHLPTKLSVGERQRVAIARSLANDPIAILADEPTGNLDSKTGVEILALFDQLHEQGKTLVVITHDHSVAARAQRTIEVKDGQLIRDTLLTEVSE
ncbi:ABC transporter ATP-binding protein [Roseimaritima ulvae]|uniref:Lipoprotein-releasing system ATP-binding protein LolD n=1 Tax=Roseimaritima ulvae TaxID=980254 RepID=A0A5B9QLY3_9BACT|nr:ABC transporter ATP-binding protein [Roseimaritima ulvae]QEG40048.1 Lipoprotein-releasing system ATP-binding protein LolD [Roseimaritima ulvae]